MSALPDPPEPVLEAAARELTKATAAHPRIYEVPPEQGRKILADLQNGEGIEKPPVDDQWVDVDVGPRGTVRTRIVRPAWAVGDLPVLIYIHGAGWVFGDENTHDRVVREFAVGAGVTVVFPVYDLAPEAKYPVQIEQNYAVAQWVAKYGREYAMDTSRIAVCGDSVGGNMATVLALMAAERGDVNLLAQVLLYPVTNADFDTASYQQFADGYYLTRDEMEWFWDQYLPDPDQRHDIYASPLQAPLDRLASLPTTLVITGEADVLRDEGEAYAAKLRAVGVDVTAVRVAGMVHDFMMLDSLRDCRATAAALTLATDAVRRALSPA
ncbi:MAG: alpha/beta hydrolase [Nocardiaceae bacterium]|nr:alpha/beta hydrolase [Nocardiaceae bacterium]